MSARTDEAILAAARARLAPASRFCARHAAGLRAAAALVLSAVSLVGLVVQGRLHHADTIVFCGLLPLPLALPGIGRRTGFALVALVALLQWLLSTPQLADAAVLLALFAVTLDGELPELALAAAVTEAGAVMAALRWSPDDPAKVWVAITGLAVAAAALGLLLRERRALVVSMRERAARLELERDQEGRLGAAAERARIAREMHDIVSHNLTVMIGLADGAAYALRTAPDTSLTAMQRVSDTGRVALGEMRRLLGVLRDEPAAGPLAPQPGLDRLDELVAQVRAAGVPVRLSREGDGRTLPGGVQLAVFRVAQEALTNTLKHAGRPAAAEVSLVCGDGWVELAIADTSGPGPADATATPAFAPAGAPAGGRGLTGMRERAAASGGVLETGPRADGLGWRVRFAIGVEVPVA